MPLRGTGSTFSRVPSILTEAQYGSTLYTVQMTSSPILSFGEGLNFGMTLIFLVPLVLLEEEWSISMVPNTEATI